MNFNQKLIRALHNHPRNSKSFAKVTFTHTDINHQVWVLEVQNHPSRFCITRIRPLPLLQECFDKDKLTDKIEQGIHPHLNMNHLLENLPQWMD